MLHPWTPAVAQQSPEEPSVPVTVSDPCSCSIPATVKLILGRTGHYEWWTCIDAALRRLPDHHSAAATAPHFSVFLISFLWPRFVDPAYAKFLRSVISFSHYIFLLHSLITFFYSVYAACYHCGVSLGGRLPQFLFVTIWFPSYWWTSDLRIIKELLWWTPCGISSEVFLALQP